MSEIAVIKNKWTLEEGLMLLTKYGNPRIVMIDGDWYAVVDLFVKAEGASGSINSGFNNTSPTDALNLLITRTLNVVGKNDN